MQNIPKVDRVLEWPTVRTALARYPRPTVVRAVRAVLDGLRREVRAGALAEIPHAEVLADHVLRELALLSSVCLKRVVNGTGVVIHTNLGRSLLAAPVRQTLAEIAFNYSNLEFDLERGERGSRYTHVEQLLCELTGAETALVVNNNAAAVLLALSALAAGKEVVVSRGELVEIGGSFRIPDVMRQSGALLREVGTTNRTHSRDYREAVSPDTALLLKVHTSNYAVVGFTAEVTAGEMVRIGREFSLPVMADVGSGNLVDLSPFGLGSEPLVQDFLRAGVDVVTFSGDKLLGGPQAGIVVGKKDFVEPLKKHPLLRALRVDKMTVAALEGTLRLYRDERQALAEIPTLRMLALSAAELEVRGKSLLRRLRRTVPASVTLALTNGFSQVGGGAFPLVELPTVLLAVGSGCATPQEVEKALRFAPVPVIGRIWRDTLVLDLRTIQDDDVPALTSAICAIPTVLEAGTSQS
jgi:L-seryl-tRNA(Ser) seleniumtransferase